jgi:hypothetical protein
VPLAVLESLQYAALSWPARALLIELAAQFNGHNNGDQSAAFALHRKRGWTRSTLQAATVELEQAGFIVRTRQGGRNACNLYGLTWQPLDECAGKLDAGHRIGGPASRLWDKKNLARHSG